MRRKPTPQPYQTPQRSSTPESTQSSSAASTNKSATKMATPLSTSPPAPLSTKLPKPNRADISAAASAEDIAVAQSRYEKWANANKITDMELENASASAYWRRHHPMVKNRHPQASMSDVHAQAEAMHVANTNDPLDTEYELPHNDPTAMNYPRQLIPLECGPVSDVIRQGTISPHGTFSPFASAPSNCITVLSIPETDEASAASGGIGEEWLSTMSVNLIFSIMWGFSRGFSWLPFALKHAPRGTRTKTFTAHMATHIENSVHRFFVAGFSFVPVRRTIRWMRDREDMWNYVLASSVIGGGMTYRFGIKKSFSYACLFGFFMYHAQKRLVSDMLSPQEALQDEPHTVAYNATRPQITRVRGFFRRD